MELFSEIEIVDSLMERAELHGNLPVCCISILTYNGVEGGKKDNTGDIVCTMKSNCIHREYIDILPLENRKQVSNHSAPKAKLFPVGQIGKLFGFIGLTEQYSLPECTSNGNLSFPNYFKAQYLRYYLYHHSKIRFGAQNPVIILGEDSLLMEALIDIGKYTNSHLPVLIQGETGTGKELWARSLHLLSKRYKGPFLPVNCSHLIDDQLAISTLFGHKQGSYTGAEADRKGFFERANGGTVFLDEINCLPPRVQSILLRTIETGEIQKLGSDSPDLVDVKLIGATNSDLERCRFSGKIRNDFLYRIKGHSIHLPSLRERNKADISQLAGFFMRELNGQLNQHKKLTTDTHRMLRNANWFGNIRELRNALVGAYYNSENQIYIEPEHFPPAVKTDGINQRNGSGSDMERRLFNSLIFEEKSFWEVVYAPFMNRDLNRGQVSEVVRMGMESVTNLKELTDVFNIPKTQYRKFIDFLRNHSIVYS